MGATPSRVPSGLIKLTYDDYASIPNDGRRYEVLDGELCMTPSPTPRHQAVSRNLQRILDNHIVARGLGSLFDAPLDVILAPTTVAQPDLLFIRAGRESIVTERAIEGTPDLVVEILSPGSARQDRVVKAKLYARHRAAHYWIVDPETRTLEEHRLRGRGYRRTGRHRGGVKFRPALFPDLEIDLARVWC
jgi:Uma2 family endonuclease